MLLNTTTHVFVGKLKYNVWLCSTLKKKTFSKYCQKCLSNRISLHFNFFIFYEKFAIVVRLLGFSREAEQSPNLDRRKQPVEGEFLNFKEKGKMTSFLKKNERAVTL